MGQSLFGPVQSVFEALVANGGWTEVRSKSDGDGSEIEICKDGLVLFNWIYRRESDAGVRLADPTPFYAELPAWYTKPSLHEILGQIGVTPLGMEDDLNLAAKNCVAIKALLQDQTWHEARLERQIEKKREAIDFLDRVNPSNAEKMNSIFLQRRPEAAQRTNS